MIRRITYRQKVVSFLATTFLMVVGLSIGVSAAQSNEIVIDGSNIRNYLESGIYHVRSSVTYPFGLRIKDESDVTLILDKDVTLTANGMDAYYYQFELLGRVSKITYPATAGIVVPKNAKLTIKGEGKVVAKGGKGYDAADGNQCIGGGWAYGWIVGKNAASAWSGAGGDGGTGAGGGAAGIGGDGVDGGSGGGGANGTIEIIEPEGFRKSQSGSFGSDGDDGNTMGEVYILDSVTVEAVAGGSGNKANAGETDEYLKDDGFVDNIYYTASAALFGSSGKYFLGAGAGGSGGGGGASGVSANIGGSGAGGGGGGGGNDGGWHLAPTGTLVTTGWKDAKGTDGLSDGRGGNGGIGGHTVECGNEPAARGGNPGKGGDGGNLYIASTAKVTTPAGGKRDNDGKAAKVIPLCRTDFTIYVDDKTGHDYATGRNIVLKDEENNVTQLEEKNGKYSGYVPKGSETYRIYVDGENTGKTIIPDKDILSTDLRFYDMDISVTIDDKPVSDKSVGLVQDFITKTALQYNDESGSYRGLVLQKGIDKEDTYEIWVDGVAFDTNVKADSTDHTCTVKYYTAGVRVEIDGKTWSDRTVSLYQNGEIKYQTKYDKTTEKYQAVVPFMTNSGDNGNQYDVYVNNEKTGVTVSSSPNENERNATVVYSRAKVHLNNGGENWEGQIVTIQKGSESILLNYDKDNKAYQTVLFTGDSETYKVYVNGKLTTGEICMTGNDKREITLSYMKATVSVKKDSQPWTKGPTCTLLQDGIIKYTLANQGGGTYSLSGVEEGTYDLNVSGSNSDADVKMQITADAPTATVEYYTVNFHKNIGTKDDVITAKQIIHSGEYASPAANPYQSGYTFLNWSVDTKGSKEYDFAAKVTQTLDLYAKWVRPSVRIGDYVKCDESGVVNGDGDYFRMPNLIINGYPNKGKVINTVVIYLSNVTADKLNMPSGSLRTDAIEKNGDGKITLRFYDEADKTNCEGPVTIAEAQKTLRNMILKVVDPSKDATVSVMVYGDTNLVSEREDSKNN